MSDPKERAPSTRAPAGDSKRSGRAGVDERGNSVWEWQLETGVYSRDISTQKLRKLDLGDLSIAETATHQRPSGFESAGRNPYDNARNTAHTTQTSSPGAPPARKPMDLKHLDEWMQIRKQLEQQKKDGDED